MLTRSARSDSVAIAEGVDRALMGVNEDIADCRRLDIELRDVLKK